MEMQTRRPDGNDDVRPSDRPIEVAAPQRSAQGSSETSAPGLGPTKADRCSRRSGMIARGTPTTRRDAFDFGGSRVTADLGARRSENAARTWTHPATKSKS